MTAFCVVVNLCSAYCLCVRLFVVTRAVLPEIKAKQNWKRGERPRLIPIKWVILKHWN